MTKKDKIKKCQDIIKTHNDYDLLTGEDKEFLLELFKSHPYYSLKKGCGISEIFVKTNRPYKTRGFWLQRINGSKTDISFHICISGKKTPELDFKIGMRAAIIDDIIKAKLAICEHVKNCVLCGKEININNSHLDHVIKLREIQRNFINEYGIKDFEKLITTDWDKTIGVEIIDTGIKEKWIEYHNKIAKFQLLCSNCNLRIH